MEAFLGEVCCRRFQGRRWARRGPRHNLGRVLRGSPSALSVRQMATSAEAEVVKIVLEKVIAHALIKACCKVFMPRHGGSTGLPVEDLRHQAGLWKTRFKRVPALYGWVVLPLT